MCSRPPPRATLAARVAGAGGGAPVRPLAPAAKPEAGFFAAPPFFFCCRLGGRKTNRDKPEAMAAQVQIVRTSPAASRSEASH